MPRRYLHHLAGRLAVLVTVADGDGKPVGYATVDGSWTSLVATATCTTGATGSCTVTSQRVRKSTESLTFSVGSVRHDALR